MFVVSFDNFLFLFYSRPSKGRSESDCDVHSMVNAGSIASAKCSEDLENILPERHKSLQMPLAPLPITKVRFDEIPSGNKKNLLHQKVILTKKEKKEFVILEQKQKKEPRL